jgi:nucleotide-binding universal stress UspA family protein/GNAT superfamily N-acetyltransferase
VARQLGGKRRRGQVELPDGTTLAVRPIDADDRDLLVSMFERLGEESRYRRFLTPKKRLTDRELTALTAVDHHGHEALVALAPEADDEGVAVARYVRSATDPEVAEVAVTVTDDWQRRGVGGAVLGQLADRARSEGIRRFSALILEENRPVRELFGRLGDVSLTPVGDGQLEMEMDLPDRAGVGPGLARALRAAARREISVAAGLLHRGPEAVRARLAALSPPPPARHAGPIRTILVASDGSEGARRAARCAGALAAAVEAKLIMVRAHGVRLPGQASKQAAGEPDSDTPDRAGRRDSDPEVVALAEEVEQHESIEVSTHVRRGEAAGAILDVAEEEAVDLIVVGDRGMTGASRWLLGSVANRVSHHAACSVLIVRSH